MGVSTDEKVGKDAGELAGLDIITGITATKGIDAVLATEPDCVVYCAMGDTRLTGGDGRRHARSCAAGINVVGSAPGTLQYPWGVMPDKYIERVEEAAREGNSSVYITGVDPGFVTDLMPFALASTCQRIEQVRTMEIADYATYDGAEVMFDVMGFGNPIGDLPMLFHARRARHRLGHRDPPDWPRDWASRSTRSPRLSSRSPHRRISTSPPAASPRAPSRRCASRSTAWSRASPSSWSSTSPDCATICARTGRSRPSPAAPTGWRSSASRPTSSTSARPATAATTTTPRSWPRRAGS